MGRRRLRLQRAGQSGWGSHQRAIQFGNTRSPCEFEFRLIEGERELILTDLPSPLLYSSDLVSETSLIYITVYDRAQEGEGFLGIREIRPVCRNGFVMDSWFK